MSIASELNNLEGNIEDSYDAVNNMGEGALTGITAIRGNLTWFTA